MVVQGCLVLENFHLETWLQKSGWSGCVRVGGV